MRLPSEVTTIEIQRVQGDQLLHDAIVKWAFTKKGQSFADWAIERGILSESYAGMNSVADVLAKYTQTLSDVYERIDVLLAEEDDDE